MTFVERMAHRIQRIRKRRELSQEALAAKAAISREYLARIETGQHDPRVSILVRIAKALKVKLDDLVK